MHPAFLFRYNVDIQPSANYLSSMKSTFAFPMSRKLSSSAKRTASTIGICLVILASLTSSGLPSPLYAIYQAELGLTNTWVNLLFSAYAVGVMLTLIVMMLWGDKVTDRRQIILGSALLLVASALCLLFSHNVWYLILGRFVSGIATGSLLGSANAALLELDNGRKPKSIAIIATLSFTGGSALGPMLSGYFIKASFYPTIIPYIVLIALAIIAIPLFMMTPLPLASRSKDQLSRTTWSIAPYFSLPFAVSALTLVSGWAVGAVFMSSGQLFTSQLAMVTDVFLAATLITTFQVSAGVGQLLGGRFSQTSAIVTGAVIFAGAQALMCFFALHAMTVLYSISSLFVGFGYGIAFVGATGNVNTHAPAEQRAGYISAYYIIGYIFGNAVPAVIVGSVIDGYSLAKSMVTFSLWIALVATVLIVLTLRLQRMNRSH